jgi:hypothetical protein
MEFRVCVCVLALVIQHAKRMHHIILSVITEVQQALEQMYGGNEEKKRKKKK